MCWTWLTTRALNTTKRINAICQSQKTLFRFFFSLLKPFEIQRVSDSHVQSMLFSHIYTHNKATFKDVEFEAIFTLPWDPSRLFALNKKRKLFFLQIFPWKRAFHLLIFPVYNIFPKKKRNNTWATEQADTLRFVWQ